MEIVVGILLGIILLLALAIGCNSLRKAKEIHLLENNIVVSKEFYESAERVCDLMLRAPSVAHQNKYLPASIASLDKELLSMKREEVKRDLAEIKS